jgi:hypothetical protein
MRGRLRAARWAAATRGVAGGGILPRGGMDHSGGLLLYGMTDCRGARIMRPREGQDADGGYFTAAAFIASTIKDEAKNTSQKE